MEQAVRRLHADAGVAPGCPLAEDVLAPRVVDEARHVALRRRQGPDVVPRRVEHHLRTFLHVRHQLAEGLVLGVEDVNHDLTALLEPEDLRQHHHPLGTSDGVLLDILPDVHVGDAQLRQLVGHCRLRVVHAVEQHQVGLQSEQHLEVQLRPHVAHAVAPGEQRRTVDVVQARDTHHAVRRPEGVQHAHVARRHADDASRSGGNHDPVEVLGGLFAAACHEVRHRHVTGVLPRVRHLDDGALPVPGAPYVEALGTGVVIGHVRVHLLVGGRTVGAGCRQPEAEEQQGEEMRSHKRQNSKSSETR